MAEGKRVMCGIAGIVNQRAPIDPATLESMSETIAHRGPDDAGAWLSPDRTIGLAHRRLSIIDLGAGHQPMSSPGGEVTIVYNGEIYNHVALRGDLEKRGHRFRTRCDTEVVVAAYLEYGEDCLAKLDGMFAFLLYDDSRRHVFFARDRFGKKPLYYARTSDGYIWASEIKALLTHPDVTPDVNRTAFHHYLSFLATPAPDTLFAGIGKLPAAHCGTWSAGAGLRIRRWWQLPTDKIGVSDAEAAATVRELFEDAVRKRMMSDVPFGVYLSGGIDSTANVAVMSQIMQQPVNTFSIAFAGEPKLNELHEARFAAEYYKTNHCEIVITDEDALGSLPEVIHHQDEPIADPVCVPLYHLAKRTKELGVTVVQIGEGSDEVFFGYPGYVQVLAGARRLWKTRRSIPRLPLQAAAQLYASIRPGARSEFAIESIRCGVPAPHAVAGLAQWDKRRLLRPDGSAPEPALTYLRHAVGAATTEQELSDIALAHETLIRLPELLLMRVDKMTMASSVEGRAPFLDRALVDYVARLPLSVRYARDTTKAPLRAAMRGLVPDVVLDRPKKGFGAPVWRWFTSFRHLARVALQRSEMDEYFSGTAVASLLDGPASSRQGFHTWILLNFALWHYHFVEGRDLHELLESVTGQDDSADGSGQNPRRVRMSSAR